METDAHAAGLRRADFVDVGDRVGEDIFARGLCLPSDNKMTEEEQEIVVGVIRELFE